MVFPQAAAHRRRSRRSSISCHGVRLEDIPICESVQSGLHSLGYRQGRFIVDAARSEISEHAVHDFQSKLLDALGAAI